MTTKEQELKALEKIRQIVKDLGPDSYIGTAFEGCFEIAEENIENDFACSMKQRVEAMVIENSRLRDTIKELETKLAESEKDYEATHEAAHIISDQKDAEIAALKEKILSEDDLTDCIALIRDRIQENKEDMAKAGKDIVALADDPSSTGFQRAVSQHRGAKHSMEYCEALRDRLQKTLNPVKLD